MNRRILIVGGPRTGKTTAAKRIGEELGILVRSTDELIGRYDWSGVSERVAEWMDQPGPWIIEGVAVARACRKWLAAHPDAPTLPAESVVCLWAPLATLTPAQAAMGKGVRTVWSEVLTELLRRGQDVRALTRDIR